MSASKRPSQQAENVKRTPPNVCQGCGHAPEHHGQVFEKSCSWKGCGCPQYVRKVTL